MACYLMNRLPSRSRHSSTPLETLMHQPPTYSQLKVFGCACWPNLRPYNTAKLNYRSLQCVFIGYSPMHKGYKCLHIPTNRIYILRDVIFDEHVFLFANNHSTTAPPTEEHILLPTLNPLALPLTNEQYMNMVVPTTVHDVSNPPLVSSGDDFRSPGPCTTTDAAATSSTAHAS
jgi:hypothetical protein